LIENLNQICFNTFCSFIRQNTK